jgi:hypothetical protein
VTPLTAGQLADFEEYLQGKEAMLTLLPLLTDTWQVSAAGEREVAGRAADGLRIRRKKWTALTYWDKKTHLLMAAEYPHKRLIEPEDSKRKATTREARFGAYKAFAGILFHTQLRSFAGGKSLGRVEFTAIELMKELPRSVIAAPK